MCGIYGITEKNEKLITSIIKKCSHRGPDGFDLFSNDKLTLGHNLLSITSKPNDGKQPWISERKNVLVYNGEIFNYYQLKEKYQDFVETAETFPKFLVKFCIFNILFMFSFS